MSGGTLYADRAQVEAWFAKARAGQRMMYAMGPALDPNNPTVQVVNGWRDAGEIVPLKKRRDGVLEHLVQRREPMQADLPPPRLRLGAELEGTPEGAVLRVLSRCANLGQPCPSNAELARLAALRDAAAARYRFNNLRDAGHIEVRQGSTFSGRRVMVVATGLWTAEPAGEQPRPAAALIESRA